MKKILIPALAILFFAGCTNPADEFDLNVDTDFMEYTMMVEFINAGDHTEEIEDLTIEIAGPDADAILEASGKKEFQVANGRIVLAVNPSSKPEGDKALNFNIKAEAPGYLPINLPAYFRNDEKEQIITVNMVNLEKTPEGVANETSTATLNSGQLDADKVVTVTPSGNKKTGAEVTLSSGTKFFDADGNELTGNQLEVSLTHFDAEGDPSVNSFPGGFMPESVVGPSGSQEEIFFNTAGFASIDMTVDGQVVRQFSQPIDVNVTVDPTVNNLNTGSAIQAGDSIPIWSYDVEEGTWRYEKTGVVVDNNGELEVEFSTDHLSWYNLDFYGNTCRWYDANGGVTISVSGDNASAYDYFLCDVVFASNGQSVSYWSTKSQYIYDGKQISFYNAPTTMCKFRIYEGSSWYNKGNLIVESEPFMPCSDQITVNVPGSVFPEQASLSLQATCASNPNFVMRPNFYLYYKDPTYGYYRYLTYVYQGSATTTKLNIGEAYDFRVYYNGQYFDFTETVQKDNVFHVELDESTCNTFF